MKSLRKSLNGNKDSVKMQISTPMPLPPVSKPPTSMLPPQAVIRALEPYRSKAPQELSFQKGDFFYVLGHPDNHSEYFEAHNPVSGSRGLVPRAMFEEFNKNTSPGVRSPPPTSPNAFPIQQKIISPPAPRPPKTQVFYAIVLHDFEAERPDELDAKKGEAITVVAQSNREWFVAKPIGKLGRPGLIPVSFVEIHDPSTGTPVQDVEALMDRGDLPKVEDWKRAMYNYKQNSITLGVLDAPSRESVANSPYSSPVQPQSPYSAPVTPQSPMPSQTPPSKHTNHATTPLPDGILLTADVVSFHYENQEYLFRIHAVFQPYGPDDEELPGSKNLILFRVYEDFYKFQVALLNQFPREAGQDPHHERVLPFMPGPAQNVDHALTATRQIELNEYLNQLCNLNDSGMSHILEHIIVRDFFKVRAGDVEGNGPPKTHELERLFAFDQEAHAQSQENDEYADEMQDSMGRLSVQPGHHDRRSNGSTYEDEGYAGSPKMPGHPYALGSPQERKASTDSSLRLQAHAQNHHQRTGSSASVQRIQPSLSRAESPATERSSTPQSSWNSSNVKTHSQSSASISSSSRPPLSATSSSTGGRSRSHSAATTHTLNNPPISASNPQTAFVKIKIFDRLSDDLIAIRVHPKVTHAELMDKVQARLGSEVAQLRFRDSMNNNELVGVFDDDGLREWMDRTDKHVLYAD